MLIACYLVYSQRMSGDEAITLVRSNRCVVVGRLVVAVHTPSPLHIHYHPSLTLPPPSLHMHSPLVDNISSPDGVSAASVSALPSLTPACHTPSSSSLLSHSYCSPSYLVWHVPNVKFTSTRQEAGGCFIPLSPSYPSPLPSSSFPPSLTSSPPTHSYTSTDPSPYLSPSPPHPHRPGSIQTRPQIEIVQQFDIFLRPLWNFYPPQMSDSTSLSSTFEKYLHNQSLLLHGTEKRDLKYIPKVRVPSGSEFSS